VTRPVAHLRVSDGGRAVTAERGMAVIEIESILDHEPVVIE
jgi:hypothetical protein